MVLFDEKDLNPENIKYFPSSDFEDEKVPSFKITALRLFQISLIFLVIMLYYYTAIEIDLLRIILITYSCANIAYLPVIIIFEDKIFKKWHAIEHKIGNIVNNDLVEMGKEMTLKETLTALKSTNSYSNKCGSRFMFTKINTLLIILILMPYIFPGYHIVFQIFLGFLIGNFSSRLFLNRFIQKIVLLDEPTNEQYQEGARVFFQINTHIKQLQQNY